MGYVISKIDTITRLAPDDLLIVCTSFEERSLRFLSLLSPSYSCAHCAIIDYGGVKGPARSQFYAGKTAVTLRNQLSPFCASPPELLICSRLDPFSVVRQLHHIIHQLPKCDTITVDISSLTKQHQLLLLKFIYSKMFQGRMRVIYTSAGEYRPKELTDGVQEIVTIPSFEGRFDPRKRKALLTFLGFERDRSLCAWNMIEPERTIPIIGYEPERDKWYAAATNHNQSLLSQKGVDPPIKLPCYDPFKVWFNLSQLVKELSDQYNIYIVPLGTKPQVLGLFLLTSRDLANVRLVYPVPFRYTKYYGTRGVGQTYEYLI